MLRNWNFPAFLWECKMVQPFEKKLSVSYKVKHSLPHDPGTSLLDIYLTEMIIPEYLQQLYS